MAILEINLSPSKRDLRWFGFLIFLLFSFIGGILWWRGSSLTVAMPLWSIGVILCILYYTVSPSRRPMYLGFMYCIYPLGWTVSHLLFGAIFFLIMTPIGLFLRIFGYDPLELRTRGTEPSYWSARRRPKSASQYFRQF